MSFFSNLVKHELMETFQIRALVRNMVLPDIWIPDTVFKAASGKLIYSSSLFTAFFVVLGQFLKFLIAIF